MSMERELMASVLGMLAKGKRQHYYAVRSRHGSHDWYVALHDPETLASYSGRDVTLSSGLTLGYDHVAMTQEEDQALKLLDWMRMRTLQLVAEVLKHVQRGHYNDELKARVSDFLLAELRDKAQPLITKIQALPSQLRCGPVDEWCLAALGDAAHERLSEIRDRRDQIRRIMSRLGWPADKCVSCGIWMEERDQKREVR